MRKREESREFHASKNLAFLSEQGFYIDTENYSTTISDYSPHIVMTFDNLAAFERCSQNIEATINSNSVQRISVFEAINYEDLATREAPASAPNYTMAQVRQDIGILDNDFIGRGINVGQIESGTTDNATHAQLAHLTVNRGGATNRTSHSTEVDRTMVGSLGIASGVAAVHSFAITGLNMLDATNWLLQPARNVRLINISWGGNAGQYEWMAAFLDFHIRNNNVTVVASSGNGGTSTNQAAGSPSTGYNVISVGSSNANGNVSNYSSFGMPAGPNMRKPSIVAPGTWLETTDFVNAGTSFAAPVVTGVVARLMEEFPILQTRPDMVHAALLVSAVPVNGHIAGTWDQHAGAGRVHYERARQAVRNAITFENATRNGTNIVRSTSTINVVPNNQIRVVAFWMTNSATNNNTAPNNVIRENIHTNYDLRVRNHSTGTLLAESAHNSNIEILWHTPTLNQLRFEVVQMANMNTNNNQADIGVVTWIYETLYPVTVTSTSPRTVQITGAPGRMTDNMEIPSTITVGDNAHSVIAIGNSAFASQTQLSQITIPASVQEIGQNAFPSNIQVRSRAGFTIQNNIVTGCHESAASYVEIPNGIASIAANAFDGQTSLTRVLIPESVTAIGNNAFKGCVNLRTVIDLRLTPQTINSTTFAGVSRGNTTLIVLAEKTQTYKSAGWTDFAISEYTVIKTAQELKNIANNTSGNYLLLKDIDLAPLGEWTPIPYFFGTLDGNGKTIRNLKITDLQNIINPGYIDTGMFGLNFGTIKNFALEDVNIWYSQDHSALWSNVGAVCSYNGPSGKIINISVTGHIDVHRYNSSLGGIAGLNEGTIKDCVVGNGQLFVSAAETRGSLHLSGNGEIGGITGTNRGSGRIEECTAKGITIDHYHVIVNRSIGGIVGYNDHAHVQNSSIYDSVIRNWGQDGSAGACPYMGKVVGLSWEGSVWYSYSFSTTLNSGTLKNTTSTGNQLANFGTQFQQWAGNLWGTVDAR